MAKLFCFWFYGDVFQSYWRLRLLKLLTDPSPPRSRLLTSICWWFMADGSCEIWLIPIRPFTVIAVALLAIAALMPLVVAVGPSPPMLPKLAIPLIPELLVIPFPTKQFPPFSDCAIPFTSFPNVLAPDDINISCRICCTELWGSLWSASWDWGCVDGGCIVAIFGSVVLLDVEGDVNGEDGLGWDGGSEVDEPDDGIWTVLPVYGLFTELIGFSCREFIEFWWSRLATVAPDVGVDDGTLIELFTPTTPLLPAVSGTPTGCAELCSLWFEFWAIPCCCSSVCWAWWARRADEPEVFRGKLIRLSVRWSKQIGLSSLKSKNGNPLVN